MPSTKILPVEYSTFSTFPTKSANSPLIMRTVSPVLSGTRLTLCLAVKSSDNRADNIFPQVGFAFRHRHHYHISDTGGGDSSEAPVVSSDVYEFQFFRSGVIGAGETGADWKAASDSGPVLYHSTRAYRSSLRRGHVYSATPFLSITTNETSLLSGLHSAMVTRSPVVAAMHGGLWASVLLLRLSYLLYFG